VSRNLCSTECHRCDSEVDLDEAPRFILPTEAGVYFDEFDGMLVANATCPRCGARYLAWCADVPGRAYPRRPDFDMKYFDLSYRSTFNDEPGPDDLPKPTVLAELDNWLASNGQMGNGRVEEAREALAEMLGWTDD